MKKILHLIFLLFCILINSQDLNYNLLLEDKGDFYYAKRENLTDVWIKMIGKTVKKKNKQGKTITVKGKEIDELYRCDCEDNSLKQLNTDYPTQYTKAAPETVAQLTIDFTCSNLIYTDFVGQTEGGFDIFLGSNKKIGNYHDIWVKSILNKDFEHTPTNGLIMNPKTGEIKVSENEKIEVLRTYDIEKLRVDCNSKKIGVIITFQYDQENNQLTEYNPPYSSTHLGLQDISNDYFELIYNKICTKNY